MNRLFLVLSAVLFFGIIAGCSGEKNPDPEEEGKVLVLMYHRIVDGTAANLYQRSLSDLEADLEYLKSNNVKILSFNDLESIQVSGKMPAGNSAILTFDDGDNSSYSLARPLLMKYNAGATFFLWTYMIGHDSFLTWDEVADMSNYTTSGGEHPFIFGSHSFSHPYLADMKSSFSTLTEYNAFLDYELGVSKEMIENHTPVPVTAFALPYGDGAGDQDIISAAVRNGYKFIRTSVRGRIDTPMQDFYNIPSLPMLNDTESELIGAYLGI